mmetsp:Transcript_28963/g.25619  ORF Transcript_28963/g.25619 Transcript_28963/m.25619 type:complete len:101 (+) Transcript_28963:279-581(+)
MKTLKKNASSGLFSIHYADNSRNNLPNKYSQKGKTLKEFTGSFMNRTRNLKSPKYNKSIKITQYEDISSVLDKIENENFPMLKSFNYKKSIFNPSEESII